MSNFQCLKIADKRRTAIVADWEHWLKQADLLYEKFLERVGGSPFDYHEVACVGFLASSAAMAGYLPMNEYDVFKRGRSDKRTKERGRADLWFDAGKYCYSFEFKKTRRPATLSYLHERLVYAYDDVKRVPKDECHFAAACLIALPQNEKRQSICHQFSGHDDVDFSYRIGPDSEPTFLFFQLKV